MGTSRDATVLAGLTQDFRPFAAYCRSSGAVSRLEYTGKSVQSSAGHGVMLARDDRMLFVGNGLHVDYLFDRHGSLFDEEAISLSLRNGYHRAPISISLSGNPNSDVVFAAGFVKPVRDRLGERREKYVITANEPFYQPGCKGFSIKDLMIANNDGLMVHIPMKHYEISGNSAREIADNLLDYMGQDVSSACAAVFEKDPNLQMAWHMAVRNR